MRPSPSKRPDSNSHSIEISPRPKRNSKRGSQRHGLPSGSGWHTPHLLSLLLLRLDLRSHRRDLAALLVSLLIAICLAPQVQNFSRRDDYEREIVPLAWGWQVLEATEGRLYDARFTARGAITPQSARDIAIVAIDQASIDALQEWPWPRNWHAQLVRRLKKAGAKAIVFDVEFASRQNPGPNGELSASDRELVAASESAGNVLVSAGFRPQIVGVESGAKGQSASRNQVSTPFDELDETTLDVAFNWLPADSLGQTRRYAWRAHVGGVSLASLSALSVGMFQNKLDGEENKAFFKEIEGGRWPDAWGKNRRVPLSEMRVGRDDRAWTTPIFFWGPEGTFATYPYASVLRGAGREWAPEGLKKKFQNRIVFVGGTAPLLKDVFGAPSFVVAGQSTRAQIPGVEIHAGVAAQMLDGRYIRAQSTSSTWACLLAMCAGSALWMSLLRSRVSRVARKAQGAWSRMKAPGRVHSIVWFSLYAVLGSLPILGFWSWAQWEFSLRDTWIVSVYPLLGSALSSSSALLLFFVAESGERRKILARLRRRASPDVLEELLSSPEEIDLSPRRAEVSVLFSDLEGFTSYSESHTAAEVMNALSLYMARMVAVVHGHGGTVDKFIGDAVMAFFGAPTPRFDHAAQALACAVEMQEECARFRRDEGIDFYMRVGVHSGEVIVGDMGSDERADYTVIGDTVNLASRLEGKNKELGSRIVCSHVTHDLAEGVVDAEPARVPIKGLSQEVDVWIVYGLKGLPPSENWQSISTAKIAPELDDEAPIPLAAETELPALKSGSEGPSST